MGKVKVPYKKTIVMLYVDLNDAIFGRDWMKKFQLEFKNAKQITD